jgi:acyl-CoA thioesterase I
MARMNRRMFLSVAIAFAISQFTPFIHAEAAAEKIRVACVGDSITFGSGVADREHKSYPAVLQTLLGDKYEVKNFGVSGTTLLKHGDRPFWKTKQFEDATQFNPNVVIVKLGTNDTKPQNFKFKDEFAGDLRAMVDHFAGVPAKPKIYLCLPVPVHKPNYGINEEGLADYMPKIKEVAKEKGLPVVDLHAALQPHAEYFKDGVHPNAEGAALMAKTVSEAIAAKR